jgi:hypothetical protein
MLAIIPLLLASVVLAVQQPSFFSCRRLNCICWENYMQLQVPS